MPERKKLMYLLLCYTSMVLLNTSQSVVFKICYFVFINLIQIYFICLVS